jgi:hypothetical protein
MAPPITRWGLLQQARPVSGAVFTSGVQTTADKVLAAVTGVDRPDGVPVVDIIYLNGEVTIGGKANQDWFMTTHYPRFVSVVKQAGFTPAVYFIVADTQDDVLQNDYVDGQYPILKQSSLDVPGLSHDAVYGGSGIAASPKNRFFLLRGFDWRNVSPTSQSRA